MSHSRQSNVRMSMPDGRARFSPKPWSRRTCDRMDGKYEKWSSPWIGGSVAGLSVTDRLPIWDVISLPCAQSFGTHWSKLLTVGKKLTKINGLRLCTIQFRTTALGVSCDRAGLTPKERLAGWC